MNALVRSTRMTTRAKLLTGLLSIVFIVAAGTVSVLVRGIGENRLAGMLLEVDEVDRYLLECRRQEKNILLRGNGDSRLLLTAHVDSMLYATRSLRGMAAEDSLLVRLDGLQEHETAYANLLGVLMGASPSPNYNEAVVDSITEAARACHASVSSVREQLIEQLRAGHAAARNGSIASVVLALLLSVGVVGWLTRDIIRPLEHLREATERVTHGDIQDIDVGFSGLDAGLFRTRETLDLANAFGHMVTSLRRAVSTEVGLMDCYHMTILVLVTRALGLGGRSIIEKARARAGFGSFDEVRPENTERFLNALEDEIGNRMKPQDFLLLADTIRGLKSQ